MSARRKEARMKTKLVLLTTLAAAVLATSARAELRPGRNILPDLGGVPECRLPSANGGQDLIPVIRQLNRCLQALSQRKSGADTVIPQGFVAVAGETRSSDNEFARTAGIFLFGEARVSCSRFASDLKASLVEPANKAYLGD